VLKKFRRTRLVQNYTVPVVHAYNIVEYACAIRKKYTIGHCFAYCSVSMDLIIYLCICMCVCVCVYVLFTFNKCDILREMVADSCLVAIDAYMIDPELPWSHGYYYKIYNIKMPMNYDLILLYY
jgi:hypothetical protein